MRFSVLYNLDGLRPVLWIRNDFFSDPDPTFQLVPDQDPAFQLVSDSDPTFELVPDPDST